METEVNSKSSGVTPLAQQAIIEKDDNSEYPPKKVVIPALFAGYLVVFLVALVWIRTGKRDRIIG